MALYTGPDMVGEVIVPEWDEIPADLQKSLLDKHRYINVETDWWDTGMDCLKEMFRTMGLDAEDTYFRIHDQSMGACVVGRWTYPYEGFDDPSITADLPEGLREVKTMFDRLGTLLRLRFPTVEMRFDMRNNNNRCLQSSTTVQFRNKQVHVTYYPEEASDYDPDDYIFDEIEEESIRAFAHNVIDPEDIKAILYGLDRYIIKYFEEEWEHLVSDEAVMDALISYMPENIVSAVEDYNEQLREVEAED